VATAAAFSMPPDRLWSPTLHRINHALLLSALLLAGCVAEPNPPAAPVTPDTTPQAPGEAPPAAIETIRLPPSARAEKRALAELFAAAELHETDTVVQVNNNETRLQAVRFATGTGPVAGETRIPVPDRLIPVWGYFKQLQLIGDASNLAVAWEGSDGLGGPHPHWYKADTMNVFQANSIPARAGVSYTLVVTGTGRLDAIRLQINERGLSPVFDESPWSALAADKPVLDVGLTLDLNARRAIGGETRFAREKFFRVYAAPWGGPWGVLDYAVERGFLPGRQMLKIGPMLEQGYDDEYPNKPAFREDPERPGYIDPSFFDADWDWPETIARGIAERFADLDYALCLDVWPSFNHHAGPGIVNSRGTPADFDAAAEAAGLTVKLVAEQTGLVPAFVEVKNESDVPYEWSYHGAPVGDGGQDGWAKLADFHNRVADGVRRFVPGALVGGPTSAYPFLSDGEWGLGRRHLAFMDDTKGRLDFYSHHFYESSGLLFEDRLHEGANTYLLGRATAYLDLLRSHGAQTDNTVPFVLSEFGTLTGGAEDYQQWQAIRNWSAYLVQFMQRPDELDLCVPFAIPLQWWEPENPSALFTYDTIDENRDPTALTANRAGIASGIAGSPMTGIRPGKQSWFLDLWNGYAGGLVPVTSDTPHVNVHAVAEGKTLWLAVSNMKAQRAAFDLEAATGGGAVASVTQRRLYLERGELGYESLDVTATRERIAVAPEETTVLRVTLQRSFAPTRTLNETRHYGSRTLMPTGTPQTLTVAAPASAAHTPPHAATLRVGVQRKNGFTAPLTVTFNGVELTADLSDSAGIKHYDTCVELAVPVGAVQRENRVTLSQPDDGGMMASAVLLVTVSE